MIHASTYSPAGVILTLSVVVLPREAMVRWTSSDICLGTTVALTAWRRVPFAFPLNSRLHIVCFVVLVRWVACFIHSLDL
jgi:hypothetical protein